MDTPDVPARMQSPSTERRRALRGLAACALLGGLGACAERGPLRLGFIGGISGRVADLGIGGRNGAQLAVDDINVAGGLGGRSVELLIRDDEQDDAKARTRLAELIDAGVAFVVGPMTSSVAVALVPLATQRGVPLISPTVTTHELSGHADAFFRIVPDAPSSARHQADALLARGLRRLVTVADLNNRAFAESWCQAAAARFRQQSATVALELGYRSAPGVRFTELAQKIVAAQGTVVLFAANASDSAVLCQQVRRLDERPAFACSAWAGTEQFPQMGGRAVEGTLMAQYFDRLSTATPYLQFVERYRKRFGEDPGFPAVNAYDALNLGLEGLRRHGSDTLVASLAQPRSHTCLQRAIELDAHGDARAPMFLTEVRDGRYVAARA